MYMDNDDDYDDDGSSSRVEEGQKEGTSIQESDLKELKPL